MIPKQLQNKDFRFILVKPNDKSPIESKWQTENNYKHHSPKLLNHISYGGNVGIICGEQSNGLRILDDDTPKKGLIKIFIDNFGETFRIRDHLYFVFDNKFSDKIIFESKQLLFPDSKGKLSPHLGEMQGTSTFCVTSPSTHPDGTKYEIIKDLPIATISYDKFVKVFGDYFKEKKKKIIRDHKPSDWKGDNIINIPIGNIISFDGLRDVGRGCLQGTHPKHGSSNGMNFRVDVENNTWICFRCNRGKNSSTGCGGPSELIAVMEGIIECEAAGASCFTQEQAQQVIKIAREKYGLTTPTQDLGVARGWANSVSIVRVAKKYNFENCQICGKPFKFQDSHGMYYCDTCKVGGGLSKFAELISKRS